MLTLQEANDIRARIDKYETWRNGRTAVNVADIPAGLNVSNEEISALEVFDFIVTPPQKYFLYINEAKRIATTWTGDKLGDVTFGKTWRGNMGDVRVSIRIAAINGRNYAGTYYKSAGSYARVKMLKLKLPKFEDIEGPEFIASYLVNGDASGLEDGEREEADEFCRDNKIVNVVDVKDGDEFAMFPHPWNVRGKTAIYTCEVSR